MAHLCADLYSRVVRLEGRHEPRDALAHLVGRVHCEAQPRILLPAPLGGVVGGAARPSAEFDLVRNRLRGQPRRLDAPEQAKPQEVAPPRRAVRLPQLALVPCERFGERPECQLEWAARILSASPSIGAVLGVCENPASPS